MKILIVTRRSIHLCYTPEEACRIKQFCRASGYAFNEMIVEEVNLRYGILPFKA